MCPIMGEYTKPEADVDIATHAALTTGVHGVGSATIGKAVINRLKGLTATLSNFTTDPTNLANITDEDWTTVSGTGVRICTGAWETAQVRYDLGAIRTVLLAAKMGGWVTAGTLYIHFYYSTDGTTFISVDNLGVASFNTTSEVVCFLQTCLVRVRYIALMIQNSTAGATMSAKFYEFAALEFGDFVGSN